MQGTDYGFGVKGNTIFRIHPQGKSISPYRTGLYDTCTRPNASIGYYWVDL